jgi:hypothetical protein
VRTTRHYIFAAAILLWPLLFLRCTVPSAPPEPPAPDQTPPPQAPAPPEAASPAPSPPAPTSRPSGNSVEYQPGLLIDFARRQVEIESRVVLREGLLELLACSAHTKEHESILVTRPRPLHIYQALGLIGLTPGHPAAWDEQQERRIPPTGDELTIHILYEQDGRPVEVDAWDWLKDLSTGGAAAPRPWLFTGSLFSPRDGSFAADYDGNVISVVDFGTELIGLSEFHSADNNALWLAAFTDRIPPIGTPCTLIVGSMESTGASVAE